MEPVCQEVWGVYYGEYGVFGEYYGNSGGTVRCVWVPGECEAYLCGVSDDLSDLPAPDRVCGGWGEEFV